MIRRVALRRAPSALLSYLIYSRSSISESLLLSSQFSLLSRHAGYYTLTRRRKQSPTISLASDHQAASSQKNDRLKNALHLWAHGTPRERQIHIGKCSC